METSILITFRRVRRKINLLRPNNRPQFHVIQFIGDAPNQDHEMFGRYRDVCSAKPGADVPWAIGTEWRQLRLHDEKIDSPEKFRRVLIDDVERRNYIIDADVEVQTTDLMFCPPKPNENGEVREEVWGGMRRIDRIVYDTRLESQPLGSAFFSTIGPNSDHVPFGLTLKTV